MKKSAVLMAVLMVVSIAGMIFIHKDIRAEEKQVSYRELAIYGDAHSAQGLAVRQTIQAFEHLEWEIVNHPGEQEGCDAKFRVSQPKLGNYPEKKCPEISLEIGSELHFGSGSFPEDFPMGIMEKAIREVVDDTAAGETLEEARMLEDTIDYYPLELFAYPKQQSKDGSYYGVKASPEVDERISEYFQIPVKGGIRYYIEVTKSADGKVTDINTHMGENDVFIDDGFLTVMTGIEDTVYFTLVSESQWDYSTIKEGYGIYAIDVGGEGEVGDISLVYGVDPSARILALEAPEGLGVLEMVTEEDGKYYLSVIDCASWTQKQKLCLNVEDDPSRSSSGDLVLYASGDTMDLVIRHGDSSYELIALSSAQDSSLWNLENKERLAFNLDTDMYFDSAAALAWDGSRLALLWGAGISPAEAIQTERDYTVGIFSREGLQYAGAYLCSLEDSWQVADIEKQDGITAFSGNDMSSRRVEDAFAISWEH